MPSLSRSLSDRGNHARWRSRDDQRRSMRRLRSVRGSLPDQCGVLRTTACRHALAQGSCTAAGLRTGGWFQAVVLFHDSQHGTPLIDALARHGDGLPANVLPLSVNEVTQVGLETVVAAFAYGAANVRFLLRARPLHDVSGLSQTIAMADAILSRTWIFRPPSFQY